MEKKCRRHTVVALTVLPLMHTMRQILYWIVNSNKRLMRLFYSRLFVVFFCVINSVLRLTEWGVLSLILFLFIHLNFTSWYGFAWCSQFTERCELCKMESVTHRKYRIPRRICMSLSLCLSERTKNPNIIIYFLCDPRAVRWKNK